MLWERERKSQYKFICWDDSWEKWERNSTTKKNALNEKREWNRTHEWFFYYYA